MIKKYKWLIIAVSIGAILLSGAIALRAYNKGIYDNGYNQCVADHQKLQQAANQNKLEIKEKQDEIRNNRTDWYGFVDRLLKSSI
jgi:Tfp pilus assembly major pilin PilA